MNANIRVNATCVRVPVLRAHSVALTIECEQPMTPEEARELLTEALGIRLVDDAIDQLLLQPRDASEQTTFWSVVYVAIYVTMPAVRYRSSPPPISF